MALPINRADEAVTKLSQTLNAQYLPCNAATISLITSPRSTAGPWRYLVPTGPYALGVHTTGAAIHLICVTNNSPSTFWPYVAECVENEDLPSRDGVVAQISDGGGSVWLHYCGIAALQRRFATASAVEAVKPPIDSRLALERLWDTRALLSLIDEDRHAVLGSAYTTLRAWAEASGIFCDTLGTLDSDALLAMLHNVLSCSLEPASLDAGTIVNAFLTTYRDTSRLRAICTPSGRSIYPSNHYLASAGRAAIAEQIFRASASPNVLRFSASEHLKAIAGDYCSCIKVTAQCWAPKQRADFPHAVVAEIAAMFSQLRESCALRCERCRIWPHAFRTSEDEWVFLILVDLSRADAGLAAALESHVFVGLDEGSNRVHATFLAGWTFEAALRELLAAPAWSDGVVHEKQIEVVDCGSSPSAKFPTASATLSRLRWDPKHTAEQYEVGYIDRFVGLMWLPLEKWGHATEDEDFIPAHRIRMFRRTGDGFVVWDRDTRIDRTD